MTGSGYRGHRKTKSLALKRSPECKQIIVIEMVRVWLRCVQGSPWGENDGILSNVYVPDN